MFGQRQNLGQKIVGISHNLDDNSIALIEIDSDSSGFSGWRYDAYVKPLRLPEFMSEADVEFYVDGDPYDASDWPLSSEPGQQRPSIEIRLRGPDESATLILSPHGVSPLILDDSNSSGMTRQAIDLDGEGRGREDW
jgi:hypothetical protein